MPYNEKYNYKLLVEGLTDKHVILSLCDYHKVPECFDVVDCGGIDALFNHVGLRLTHPSLNQTIGIVLDADNDIHKRFNQIVNIIKTQIDIGDDISVENNGIIIPSSNHQKHSRVGIWLMPDNSTPGMIEDFALSLIPENDSLLLEAEHSLNRLEELRLNRFTASHRSKAKIHTFLAWQENPGCPIGMSITKRVLDPNGGLASRFVQWLTKLFVAG